MAKLQRISNKSSVALVGAETLLGADIQEVLKDRNPDVAVKPFSASGEGNFGEEEGEAVYLEPFTEETVKQSRVVIVAGTREGAEKAYRLTKAKGRGTLVLDCTGLLEDQPEVRIVSPLLGLTKTGDGWLYEIAHAASSALALMLSRLSKYQNITQVVAHVFEPVSERGKKGIAELQKQTTNLLSFKPLDKAVFDTQVSFNMLPRYGEEAGAKLASVEQRITRDLATLLSRLPNKAAIPSPSVRVVHAPVFHGYSISLWVEFERTANAQAAEEALASAQVEVRRADEEAPDNVGAAGQSGLIAGDIRVDENNPRALWIWTVGDNLRLIGDAVAEFISATMVTVQ